MVADGLRQRTIHRNNGFLIVIELWRNFDNLRSNLLSNSGFQRGFDGAAVFVFFPQPVGNSDENDFRHGVIVVSYW